MSLKACPDISDGPTKRKLSIPFNNITEPAIRVVFHAACPASFEERFLTDPQQSGDKSGMTNLLYFNKFS